MCKGANCRELSRVDVSGASALPEVARTQNPETYE